MIDFRKMYTALFNDVTDAISLLQQAQQKGEGAYVDSEDGVALELKKPGENKEDEDE